MKTAIAVNAGSSSVKLSVYVINGTTPKQIAEAQVSSVGSQNATLDYSRHGESATKGEKAGKAGESHDAAFAAILDRLVEDSDLKEVSSKGDFSFVCHRIVHGGGYENCQIINKDTYKTIEELSDLAPLHNGSALQIVRACFKQLPKSTNVACFDSQFHRTIPKHVSTYPIDQDVARRNGLRKYGFHGLSYSYIAQEVAKHLNKNVGDLNIIALHLGSGASACAIKQGKSWDTSMGLTPLSGLPGATRSGSIDPSLVFHYISDAGKLSSSSTEHLHICRAEEVLNKQAGWNAIAGTKDFGEIATSDDESHKLAFDIFVDRVCGYVGSYYVSLEGKVDALVFAGGIGEKSPQLREAVVERTKCLGFSLDSAANEKGSEAAVKDISGSDAKHRVIVCQTDEQFEMVRMCAAMKSLQ